MNIRLLGTGTGLGLWPSLNTNALLTLEETHWLIDCGQTIRSIFPALQIENISGVILTHVHADHAGGLEWLGFTSHFKFQKRVVVFADQDVLRAVASSLYPSMRFLDDRPPFNDPWETFNFYFDPHPVNGETEIVDGNSAPVRLTLNMVPHIRTMPCTSVTLQRDEQVIVWSADTKVPVYTDQPGDAKTLIFQDTSLVRNPAHCHIDDLPPANGRQVVLVHWDDGAPATKQAMIAEASKRGFILGLTGRNYSPAH